MPVTAEERDAILRVITGKWVMETIATIRADGERITNEGSHGMLAYTSLGTVFAEIHKTDTTSPKGRMDFEYCGGFEITGKDEIMHHMEWAKGIDVRDFVRKFQYDKDTGILTITGDGKKTGEKIEITWKKALDKRSKLSPEIA